MYHHVHRFWAAGSYLSLTILYTSLPRVTADIQQSRVCYPLTVHVQFHYPKQKEVQTTLQHLQSFHHRGHCGAHPSKLSAEKACFNMHISYKQQPSDQTSVRFSRFSSQIEFCQVPSGCSGTPDIAFESIGLVLTDLWWHVVPWAAVTESATLGLCCAYSSLFVCQTPTQLARFNFNPAHGVPTTVMAAWALNIFIIFIQRNLLSKRELPTRLGLKGARKLYQSRTKPGWRIMSIVLVLKVLFICERYIQ